IFFQAEDGIRDKLVTGVQTCALPISRVGGLPLLKKGPDQATFWSRKRVTVTGGRGFLGRPVVRLLEELGADVTTFSSREYNLTRSEERRVGKECRVRLAVIG